MPTLATPAAPSKPDIGPHQNTAIDVIMDEDFKLIEYGTGTGKTRIYVESIEALIYAGEVPVLVMVPNSLIEQTIEEFTLWTSKTWVNRNVMVLDGNFTIEDRRQHLKYGSFNVYVVSHESMSYPLMREGLTSKRWRAAFVDEASRFRNYSKRTITLRAIGAKSDTRYAFTGNLAPKSPADVWYVTNWLKSGIWGTTDRKTFVQNYCLLGGFEGRIPLGLRPDKAKEFRATMDSLRISCELRDVRAVMPSRIMHVRRVNITSEARKAYIQMQETLKVEIERIDDKTFISHVKTYATRLQRLQEICSGFARNLDGEVVPLPSAKTSEMLSVLEDEPDKPTVIWYWWRPEYTAIKTVLDKHGIPHTWFGHPGAVEDFMSGKVNVFVSQLAKGNYGLNLTRAQRMIYHSLPWDLDAYMQSQERNMRLTTPDDAELEVMHLTTRMSVEEYVRRRLLDKADVSSQLTRSQALELLKGAP
jgi:SNF2 family DNA or RNA helicase